MDAFDLAILGAGPGGYVAAIRGAQLGLRTCVIEPGELGGVCLNVGCIPSKTMISAGLAYKEATHGEERGLVFKGARVDMKALVAHKDRVVQGLTQGVGGLLKANKVTHIQGRGKLIGTDMVQVVGPDKRVVKAKNIILATGSSTIQIPGFSFDEKRILSSTGILGLDEVPEHLVVVGGGVIGLELACALNNLGCKQITVIEMMDQILPGVDAQIAKGLHRILAKRGFSIHLRARAHQAKATKSGVHVTFEVGRAATTVKASHCLVSVGRRPNTDDLGLEKVGIRIDQGSVVTDVQGRTSVANIFAIGDITAGPMLAHKASKEGIVAAEAAAGQASAKDFVVPGVIFTDPEVATAGITEEDARNTPGVRVGKFNVGALGKALADGTPDGFYKIITDANDRILGVHILAAHASDLITEAVLAIEMGATAEDLGMVVHPHPTMSEGLMEAAEAVHGRAIHAVNR